MLPIMNHREVIGEAKTAEQAARILRQKLSIPRGFVLRVWARSLLIQDVYGLPAAWVYSVTNH